MAGKTIDLTGNAGKGRRVWVPTRPVFVVFWDMATMVESTPIQSEETAKAAEAFSRYVAMGPGRSLRNLARVLAKSKELGQSWCIITKEGVLLPHLPSGIASLYERSATVASVYLPSRPASIDEAQETSPLCSCCGRSARRPRTRRRDQLPFAPGHRPQVLPLLAEGVTTEQWEAIKAAWGYRCAYCGKVHARLTRDHVVPRARGGMDVVANLVPACRSCNARKNDRLVFPVGWLASELQFNRENEEQLPKAIPVVSRETAKPAEAFADYVALGPKRSLRALARIYAESGRYKSAATGLRVLADWSIQFHWQEELTRLAQHRVGSSARLVVEARE